MAFNIVFTLIVFVSVFVIVAFDIMNRAYTALLGAGLLMVFSIISAPVAFSKINLDVIAILISMMALVNTIKETGVFQYVAIKAAKLARGNPLMIMLFLFVITAVISSVLPNVTTILVIAPITILIAVELGISPIPFLITQAIASNIGGTATLIGDPPNIMIGYEVPLSFNAFLHNMAPLILIIILFCVLATVILFRKMASVPDERKQRIMSFDESSAITDKRVLIISLVVLAVVILGFLFSDTLGIAPVVISMFSATILLFFSKNTAEEKFNEIDWETIFFFVGLFIIVGALEEVRIIEYLGVILSEASGNNLPAPSLVIVWGAGILSGIIDNIPFVTTMIPLIKVLNAHFGAAAGDVLWWALSAGACLGGNFTIIGASANVVAAGIASKNGYHISFLDFAKYGALYTVISLVVSSAYIFLRYIH